MRRPLVESLLWAWVLREAFGDALKAGARRVGRRVRDSRAARLAARHAARYLSRRGPDEIERGP